MTDFRANIDQILKVWKRTDINKMELTSPSLLRMLLHIGMIFKCNWNEIIKKS